MGIIICKDTPVIVQGITGKEGAFWTPKMQEYGTNIVAGVSPGKGGIKAFGVPVYNTVAKAVKDKGVELTVSYVPPALTKDVAFEAIDAGIKKIVLLADGVPIHDMLEIKRFANEKKALVIGPNSPGLATIGEAMAGFIPVWLSEIYQPGNVGIISRSGTLTNEVSFQVVASGFGLSSVVGCGGDSIPGSTFRDILALFEEDRNTHAVVIVGEIGGSMEEEASIFIRQGGFTKPVAAYIAGINAPEGKRMGHAGAIISQGKGLVKDKQEALRSAGVSIAVKPSEISSLLQKVI